MNVDLTRLEITSIINLLRRRITTDQRRWDRDDPQRRLKGIEPHGPAMDVAKWTLERRNALLEKLQRAAAEMQDE